LRVGLEGRKLSKCVEGTDLDLLPFVRWIFQKRREIYASLSGHRKRGELEFKEGLNSVKLRKLKWEKDFCSWYFIGCKIN
jgi:hypothetical protein